jgi:hypothetical protein
MRLNFEFSEQRVGDLKRLLDETRTETMKDLVNNAFTILEWAVDETKAGNEIAAVNQNQEVYRVLITPILQNVTRTMRASAAVRR